MTDLELKTFVQELHRLTSAEINSIDGLVDSAYADLCSRIGSKDYMLFMNGSDSYEIENISSDKIITISKPNDLYKLYQLSGFKGDYAVLNNNVFRLVIEGNGTYRDGSIRYVNILDFYDQYDYDLPCAYDKTTHGGSVINMFKRDMYEAVAWFILYRMSLASMPINQLIMQKTNFTQNGSIGEMDTKGFSDLSQTRKMFLDNAIMLIRRWYISYGTYDSYISK